MISERFARTVLEKVASNLHTVLRSPLLAAPGDVIKISLTNAAPGVSLSETINSALNLAFVSKDVVYNDAKSIALPASDRFDGDDLVQSELFGTPLRVRGGDHFPPYAPFPLPPLTTAIEPAQTNIPGLLGQLFGSVELKKPAVPRVTITIRWHVRDSGGVELAEGKDFIAPQGLASQDLSLLMLPLFRELRLDTLEKPEVEVRCIYARLTLTIDQVFIADTVTHTITLPGVPVMTLPLLIPTVVALGKNHNFDPAMEGATVIVVPEHSPISSAEDLNDELARIRGVLSGLTNLAKVATFLLGLRTLNTALNAPYLGFFSINAIENLHNIRIGSRILGLVPITAEDKASAVLVFGIPGTKVQFFNDEAWAGGEGKFDIEVGRDFFVVIRDLTTSGAARPKTFPNRSVSTFEPLSGFFEDNDSNFADSMSSLRFHRTWLDAVGNQIQASQERPFPRAGVVCPMEPPGRDDGPPLFER